MYNQFNDIVIVLQNFGKDLGLNEINRKFLNFYLMSRDLR